MDLRLDNYILAFPKVDPRIPTMLASSPPTEEVALEFTTPSTTRVQELPPTERRKALQLADSLKAKFERYSESEWKHHNHDEEPVCGFLEEEEDEGDEWPQLPRNSELCEGSEADPFNWAKPGSPIKLHHVSAAKLPIDFSRERSASRGTRRSGGKSIGTLPMTATSLDAVRGSKDRQRRPRLQGIFTPPAYSNSPTPGGVSYPRKPTLQSAVSAPPLPIGAPDSLAGLRSRRPTLKDIVSTSSVPTAIETNAIRYARRPTLRDMVLRGLPSPPPGATLPPDPFNLKRAATFDSTCLTSVDGRRPLSNEYQYSSKPQGNAFAQPGFWESIGAEEPKPVVHERDDLLHPSPSKAKEMDDSDMKPWLEVDQPLESATFSTNVFLRAMGRKLTKMPTNETHPFVGLAPPIDPDSREAYNQVLEALTAYWFSTAVARVESPDGEETSRSPSRVNSPQRATTTSTTSKASPLRKLTSRTAFMIQARPVIEIPKSSSSVHTLPTSLKNKVEGKIKLLDKPVFDKTVSRAYEISRLVLREVEEQFGTVMHPNLASYIQTRPQEMLTRLELCDIEENSIVKGQASKIPASAHPLASQLPGQYARAIPMDRRELEVQRQDSNESRPSEEGEDVMDGIFSKELLIFLEGASKDSRMNKTLVTQRMRLALLHKWQKSDAVGVLGPSLRILWATRWMEWAKDLYDREVEMFEEQVATAKELKRLHDGMGLDEYESSSDEEREGNGSSSDEDFTYVSFLQDIQQQYKGEGIRSLDDCESPTMDTNSSSPCPRHARTTSDIEKRRRRRTTQLHGNYLHSPDGPASPIDEQQKTGEVDDWLEMLSSGLAKEKERQKHESGLKGRGSPSKKELRIDPTFDFDKDNGSPKKRRSGHSIMSVFDSDSSDDERVGEDSEDEQDELDFEFEEDAGFDGDASVKEESDEGSDHADMKELW